jgi:hypothetical protein
MELPGQAFVRACLIGLALALLLVGMVSGTFLRHVVQVLPSVLALVILRRRAAWGAYAALPIFMIWTGIVILIWDGLFCWQVAWRPFCRSPACRSQRCG